MDRVELTVQPHEFKWRLEDFLCDRFRRISKMHLRELVRDGACEVNGRIENIGKRLKPNDFIEIDIDLTREHSGLPQDIPLDIIYEDADLIVVNKPAGMLAHPTHRDKNGTLLNALIFHLNKMQKPPREQVRDTQPPDQAEATPFIRPGLIHRLDKDTSGLMVVAKTPKAHQRMSLQFYKKTVEKKYVALVEGKIKEDAFQIDLPIGRFEDQKRWGRKEDGKRSLTNLKVLRRDIDTTLVKLEPVTGRTNQLRIHCEEIGHPIVGDTTRGGRDFDRLCLHAQKLTFDQPTSRERINCESPIEFQI